MKYLTLIVCIVFCLSGKSQIGEFTLSSTGLIYSDSTVQKLKHIVDSLQLIFKVCDLTKTYYAKQQALAQYVFVEGVQADSALLDIKAGMRFENFIAKYKAKVIENDLLVVSYNYTDYEGVERIEFSSMSFHDKYGHEFDLTQEDEQVKNLATTKCLYRYYPKNEYEEQDVQVFFFQESFKSAALPFTYARMLQYSDCMIDTTTNIFFENASREYYSTEDKASFKVSAFMNYVYTKTHYPQFTGKQNRKNWEKHRLKVEAWDTLRIAILDSLKRTDPKFMVLLSNAAIDALKTGVTDDAFEEYVARYYSKATALNLKRNRVVIGGCSMDDAPRIHALEIAKLSAETVNWEVFLRAHLDIMNDNFNRMSDGSYAWARRQTYIKELEVLDINVSDLLLGICLRIENPSSNHYFGSIGRVGRALSESAHRAELEEKMLAMIADDQLDAYNRVLMYYLYMNYRHHLESDAAKLEALEKLKPAIQKMPHYLSEKILSGL